MSAVHTLLAGACLSKIVPEEVSYLFFLPLLLLLAYSSWEYSTTVLRRLRSTHFLQLRLITTTTFAIAFLDVTREDARVRFVSLD